LLAKLPLSLSIRQHSDSGSPTVINDPEGAVAQTFRKIAIQVDATMSAFEDSARNKGPVIQILDD
jgi:ATP-binding protein involved in chromosome partitioning